MYAAGSHAYTVTNNGAAPVTLLRHCFADASNLNDVKVAVRLDAFGSPAAKKALGALSDPRLDLSMDRNGRHMEFSEYQMFPKPEKVEPESATDGEGEAGAGQSKKKKNKRADRRNKQSFGDWQAAKAWDHKVLSLTLPTLSAPHIVDVGRRNATIEWKCPFELKEGDASVLSFVVKWDGVAGDGETKTTGTTTFSVANEKFGNSIATDSSMPGVTVRKYWAVVEGLESGAKYNFKIALQYGEASTAGDEAPAEEVSNHAHTTHNTQHTTHNTQHTTHNTQHTTHNTQHTTHNTQHTTKTKEARGTN